MEQKSIQVSIRIILLFSVAIALSFVPEYLHSFFGDWYCSGSGERLQSVWHYERCNYGDWGFHQPTWHWGYRHWLFLLMGLCLAVVQAVNIFNIIDKK